ncbi:MAG: hypothetical protein L3K23_00585 [Thermoplasmata archaeon]|nr:hypothetical protein [Thermoplasmata archaeon]
MAGLNPVAQNLVQSLAQRPNLLMKMRILSLGKNYDVMDEQSNVLCTIGLDAGQNVTGSLVKGAVSSLAGDYVGRWAARSMKYTYTVKDSAGQLALTINKGSGGNKAMFDLVDVGTQVSIGTIQMKRSLIGGLKAAWVAPGAGQTLMHTKGNIIRRKYKIVDASGREIGHVRHKILAIRDVWQLQLEAGVNHLYAAVFAAILDFEKKM